MAPRLVRSAVVFYDREDGTHTFAQRGETIEFTEADEKRLDAAGALEAVGVSENEAPAGTTVDELRVDSSDEEITQYLAAGTAKEITAHAASYPPELIGRVVALESARQEPRKGLLTALGKLAE